MLQRSTSLKERIRNGQPTFGAWLTIPSLDVAEIMAGLGYDWVMIDAEHAPFDLGTLQTALAAFNGSKTVPLVRVASQDPMLIKQALDLGAEGVVVPQIENADEAKHAVAATKYPPEGTRGFGPRRASRYLAQVDQYYEAANAATLVVLQIESVNAVAAIAEIVAVPGIDVVFVGPMDLSISAGVPRQTGHPLVISAIDTVLSCCRAEGIPVCTGLSSPDVAAERSSRGAIFILTGTDHRLLQDAGVAKLHELRSAIDAAAR
jgi:2-keto-3-deoxy-L-rhamnonate aldolase RhmA